MGQAISHLNVSIDQAKFIPPHHPRFMKEKSIISISLSGVWNALMSICARVHAPFHLNNGPRIHRRDDLFRHERFRIRAVRLTRCETYKYAARSPNVRGMLPAAICVAYLSVCVCVCDANVVSSVCALRHSEIVAVSYRVYSTVAIIVNTSARSHLNGEDQLICVIKKSASPARRHSVL